MLRGEESSALINKCSDVARCDALKALTQTVKRGRRYEECLCADNVQETENKTDKTHDYYPPCSRETPEEPLRTPSEESVEKTF